MVNTSLGILKYSTVLAKAKELGGITQTSELISTKLFSSKDLGSTIAEWILVNTLNIFSKHTPTIIYEKESTTKEIISSNETLFDYIKFVF